MIKSISASLTDVMPSTFSGWLISRSKSSGVGSIGSTGRIDVGERTGGGIGGGLKISGTMRGGGMTESSVVGGGRGATGGSGRFG